LYSRGGGGEEEEEEECDMAAEVRGGRAISGCTTDNKKKKAT
jgi:hypothetical protein